MKITYPYGMVLSHNQEDRGYAFVLNHVSFLCVGQNGGWEGPNYMKSSILLLHFNFAQIV